VKEHLFVAALIFLASVLVTNGQTLPADSQPPPSRERGDTITASPPGDPALRQPDRRTTLIVVRGSSIASRVARAPQAISVVPARELAAVSGNDLSDAIARTPGVFIRSYGGLGGLRTLSLRGTSAQQNVVLIDGIRYQGTAAGALDLGNIPIESMERVEVMRGGGASLYGANALGGVVNVITQRPGSTPAAHIALDAGSFGEQGVDLGLSTGTARDRWSLVVNGRRSDGDYGFAVNEFGESSRRERSNGDASRLFARLGWRHAFDNGDEVSISAQGMAGDRGVPGAVVQGSVEQARARLDEREFFGVARHTTTIDEWSVATSATARLHRLEYRDPDARYDGPDGVRNRYLRNETALALRARRVIADAGMLDLFIEGSREGLDGDNLDPSLGSTPRRTGGSIGGSLSWLFDEGMLGWETLVEGSLRGDLFDDVDGTISPSVGLSWRLAELPIRLRARVAASYRAPSFAEQYYLNYGNAGLRPERSISIDAGSTVELENIAIEMGLFQIDTRDQIASIPKSPVSWSAHNIALVRSRGIEFSLSGHLVDTLLLMRGSYTLMETRDRTDGPTYDRLLPYAPQELASALVEARIGAWSFTISTSHVSHRFTLANENPSTALPHYTVIDLGGGYAFQLGPVSLTAYLECANLFDIDYQVVRNYPMPGRGVRGGLRIKNEE